MYERGRVTPTRNSEPDPKAAVPFYERACKAGQADACARLAAVLEKGGAVTQDLATAAALYGKSCDGGHFAGCGGLARMHEQGTGVARDPAHAKTLYERAVALEVSACDRGDAQDCIELGLFYREGTHGLAKDTAQALRLNERACSLGEPAGCYQASYLLGQATPGLTLDTKRAQSFVDRAQALIVSQCDAGVIDACHTLMTPAADYKACLAGDPDACWRVGRTYVPDTPERPGDYTRAMHFFLKGCEISAEHCVPAGELYAEGRGVPADVKRAAELFGRACDGGDLGGCFELARLYESGTGVPRDPARAATLYERMCAADSYGCTRLAGLLLAGQGVQKDAARGVTLAERACREHRDWEACLQLGLALRDGNGIARDAVAARKQLQETCRFEASLGCRAACELGDAESCVKVADAVDTGKSVPPNPAEANALYEQAIRLFDEDCARGNKTSCDGLLALYHRVRPILLKDAALALRFFTGPATPDPGKAVTTPRASTIAAKACRSTAPGPWRSMSKAARTGSSTAACAVRRSIALDRVCP